jgi:pimeloyl-[acyl-carrier protein] methyl ester esterase
MEQNILWIHGWGMSSRVWGDVSTLLPVVKHHFFTYGGCDTIDSFHSALHDKLQSVGDNTSWTLIGWSLGGMLAIEQWMNGFKNPTKYSIRSIIIVAGSLRFTNTNRHLGWPERVIERMRKQLQQDRQETLLQFASSMFSESDSHSAALITMTDTVSTCAQATDFTPAGLDAGLSYLRNTDLIARWNELHEQRTASPLLWLHGAEDSICPIAGMPLLNSAEVFVFPETGHIPFLTKPEIFYEKVRSFVYADRSHSAQ